MASKSIGSIFASLSLKDVSFAKGLKKANVALGNFGTQALKMGGVAAAAVGAGMIAGTKGAISMGGELADLSAQTGVAVSDLMRIQQAYKDNGKEAGSAGKDINKMQKAIFDASKDMGGEKDPFAEIGLSVEKLVGMNPTEQFFAIGNALKTIEHPTRQAAMAMKIFGKSGGSLLSVFKGSNLDDVNASLGKMPAIMEQFASKFDRVDDILGRLPNKSDQFFTGFTAGIIDQVLPAMESINDTDFTDVGMSIGESLGANIKAAMNLIASGAWWDLFVLEAELAFAKIMELPVLKQLAELVMFATGGGEGLSINETIAGYKDGIQSEIDAIHEEIAKKSQAKIDQNDTRQEDAKRRAYEQGRNEVYKNSPDWIDPAVIPEIKVEIPKAPERQIDEYQRRGLSLSKNPGVIQDKIMKVQEEIRDILRNAKIQGKELVWT